MYNGVGEKDKEKETKKDTDSEEEEEEPIKLGRPYTPLAKPTFEKKKPRRHSERKTEATPREEKTTKRKRTESNQDDVNKKGRMSDNTEAMKYVLQTLKEIQEGQEKLQQNQMKKDDIRKEIKEAFDDQVKKSSRKWTNGLIK